MLAVETIALSPNPVGSAREHYISTIADEIALAAESAARVFREAGAERFHSTYMPAIMIRPGTTATGSDLSFDLLCTRKEANSSLVQAIPGMSEDDVMDLLAGTSEQTWKVTHKAAEAFLEAHSSGQVAKIADKSFNVATFA